MREAEGTSTAQRSPGFHLGYRDDSVVPLRSYLSHFVIMSSVLVLRCRISMSYGIGFPVPARCPVHMQRPGV